MGGRAIFPPNAVTHDVRDGSGPHPAWQVFIWHVNSMLPDTFNTPHILLDTPALGWTTEDYDKAQVVMPTPGSGNSIMITTKLFAMWPLWDQAMKMCIEGNLHEHEGESYEEEYE